MRPAFRAGHVPPAFAQAVQWRAMDIGGVPIELPWLPPEAMAGLASHVRQAARAQLATLRVSDIIELIDRATARLLDVADPLRREADALLPQVTGFDAEMVKLGLTGYLRAFRAPQLHRFVAEDFANPKVLDEFQPAVKGGAVRAFGEGLLVHHWAGNVPGLPLWSLVSGLLVKAGNVGKLPSAEPVFASLFVRVLVELHPPLADALALVWWKGGDPEPASSLYAQADAVIAYGGNDAIAQVRRQVPASTRFLAHGHKLGVTLIGRCALDTQRGPAVARRVAQDVARWDQQGCYSPQLVVVERGAAIEADAFALYLGAELANLQRRMPRRALALDESSSVAAWRQGIEWSDRGSLIAPETSEWAVALAEAPVALAPTPGHRCVQVVALDALDEAVALLAPHAGFLQTAALAVEPARLVPLASQLGGAGITRITTPGAMAMPEAGWHHDGRFSLLDLVRMVEIEQACEAAAERFAPYRQEENP